MSKIEWTGRTWNPTTGCDRVSPGCDHCYALTLAGRLKTMGQAKYQNDGDPRTSGPGFGLTLHPDALNVPLKVRKPTTWFVNSMSDLFHPKVPEHFVAEVWDVMGAATQHTFQVLTKRPQRMSTLVGRWDNDGLFVNDEGMLDCCEAMPIGPEFGPWPLPNVWLGTSIENDRYSFRADHLRKTPAATRFLSLEPLIGPVPSLNLTGIDWVIIGGESGHGARPMDLSWARDLVSQAYEAGAAVFVKQLGFCWSGRYHRDLKGGNIDSFPADLQIREMPVAKATV